MSTQQSPTIICLSCGDTMMLANTIPEMGVRPQQLALFARLATESR